MNRALRLATLLGWFVVTYSGQTVAGPFLLLSDCNSTAKFMASQNSQVSLVCRSK